MAAPVRPLTGLFLAVLCGACRTPEAPPAPRTVVLLSLDTTRADALSSYAAEDHWRTDFPAAQRPRAATPHLDELASGGVRFAWALAHAPTTLNSHTSVFSGMDPHRHRVVRNGYPLPEDLPLLPERFAQAGWDTLAVVGSSALEAAMGLDRGFRVYDDLGPQPPGGMVLRDGKEVTDRALQAVDAMPDPAADLVLFAHYYDPHMPWFTAPPEVVARFADPLYEGPIDGSMQSVGMLTSAWLEGKLPYEHARHARALYLAQVAWVDQQVGRLLAGLRERGRLDDALVVVFADHGEALDDARGLPYTHGPDVDLNTLHVPLILWGSGSLELPEGAVVQRPVRLQDLASTVVGHAGLGEAHGDGLDLAPLWRGGTLPPTTHFAEATKPIERESKAAWNNLPFERAVVEGRDMLVGSPLAGGRATLHRVAPGQPQVDDRDRALALAELIKAWDAAAPAHRQVEMTEHTVSALQALGYLDEDPEAPAPAGAGAAANTAAGASANTEDSELSASGTP